MKYRLVFTLVLAFLQSCATVDSPAESFSFSREMKYGFYSYSFKRLEAYKPESELALIFPSIPGAIFGNPTDDILYVAEVRNSHTFELVLPSDIDAKSATIRQSGLNVVPADTKLLRLGTFHAFSPYRDHIGGGGFISTIDNEPLILVYFSNPANIRGVLTLGKQKFDHQITISNAGWNWIKVVELSDNSYRLSEFDGDKGDIEFSVVVNTAASI
ncbi:MULTISPECIES: hypothetical protein [unclassified Marinimicrobium]|jgi:hypothetical protein|uniref:hypothetical protein n=1 Tax=unclassified Marinimicrobium TaxID=2632100 RepID=UPI000C465DA5|nr:MULTISPECIES: hypothetical protein [unclassified Marinimicrobium]MAN51158.1 hypothetical protein [Marinimicrobium sp.]|tara:strand:- start:589 stop:1233 length:645 start_codon:yes stop_codon:yes gene_type:complete